MRFIPALCWIAITYWGCLLPAADIPTFDFWDKIYFDKILHFVIYAALMILLLWAAKGSHRIPEYVPENIYFYSIIFCLLMGLSIEILQATLPLNRSFDGYDFLANIIGVLFGVSVWKKIIPRTIWANL